MTRRMNRSIKVLLIYIAVLSLISLACATSKVQQLASAVPSTVTVKKPTATQPGAKPVESQDVAPAPSATTSILPQKSPTATIAAAPLSVAAKGFGQDGQEVGYGFVIDNPNTNLAYEYSEYQLAAYNADGTVVETDSGYIELIMPGQKLGVAGTLYLDEGITVSRIEVQLNPGDEYPSDLATTFTTDKVVYSKGDYYSDVQAVLSNPFNKDITSLKVSALLYNDAGEIIGGGYTYLNFLLANGSTGINVSVTSAGDVAKIELFPTISGLSVLEESEQLPEGASSLVISKQGFGQNDTSVGIGLLVENPNAGFAVETSMYRVTAYAEDGSVLDVAEGYIDLLLPKQVLGLANSLYLDEGDTVARIDAQVKAGGYTSTAELPMFTSENITFMPDEYFPEVTGEIASPYSKDVSFVLVTAIAYDDAGEIIGSGLTYLDFIPANSKAAVSISLTLAGTPAKVELYASPTSLSEIE